MSVVEVPPLFETSAVEDGHQRCEWVAGRPEHYPFHDAEYGQIPDTDDYCRERVILACLRRDIPLVEVLDRRDALWQAMKGYDLKALAALDDAWVAETSGRGTIFEDRARLAWVRDVARAVADIAKDYKELREFFLAVRFLPAEEQIQSLRENFPGFTKQDAANLMELMGTVEGNSHERECFRAV